ncbi:mitochondrial nicotinamide adenine dinucleotide transporter 1 [Rhypophila decipiens]|uniref:Mitochondrial nicotinamide adenine dinucleotide transporter 1 n=1 Tax=Rhypophila decipiens TaxID=261697 RepID=A0AAN6YJ68_9PEZI|nr:mitochondrial nicotinamide adenine dinucleotide transporter 1 [Rhypophila decipiens]
MSHDESHLSSPGPPSPAVPEGEYAALPRTEPTNLQPARSHIASVGGGLETDETMGQSTWLTFAERRAVEAPDWHFNALAGASGGFISGIVTCPLDVIKTKLQAQGGFTPSQHGADMPRTKAYKGLGGTASVIWREEGLRGMYRGLGPIIMGYLPTWAVWFSIYNQCKKYGSEYHHNPLVINFWSSIIAGASSTIATNPIWVIKTRLMSQSGGHSRHLFSFFPKGSNTPTSRPTLSMQSPWHYTSTWDAARKMYTNEGVLSFYSGLTPALLGLTHVAVQFPAYEYLRTKFTGKPMGAAHVASQDEKAHWWGILSASILSKILASSATYPHEVIRTRLQTQRRPVPGQEYMQGMGIATPGDKQGKASSQPSLTPKYKGVVTTFRTILREEGWRAFYAGMGTNMTRAVPAATVTMLTYEYVMRQLNSARARGLQKLEAQKEGSEFSG